MKHCGFVYMGNVAVYRIEEKNTHDNPYDALDEANREWSSDPEKQVARLLVVVRACDSNENSAKDKAFFGFTDAKACKLFCKRKSEIIWSNSEEQIWNGDYELIK